MKLLDWVMTIPLVVVLGAVSVMLYDYVDRHGVQVLIPIGVLTWAGISYEYFCNKEQP